MDTRLVAVAESAAWKGSSFAEMAGDCVIRAVIFVRRIARDTRGFLFGFNGEGTDTQCIVL
jgi:hypothetical protein